MIHFAFVLALLAQEEPLEALIRKLESENVQDRDRAAAELRRRSQTAMETLEKAERTASEPAEKARLRRALEEVLGYQPITMDRVRARRIRVALGPTKTRTAAAELARLSGLPVEVEAPAGIDPEIPGLAGDNAPLERLLDTLARQAGGLWLVDGRRILLFICGKVPFRIFDVRDLTSTVDDERWAHLHPDEGDASPDAQGSFSPISGEDLVAHLRAVVSPKSWEAADGKDIRFLNGLLIVANDAEVLQSVEAELEGCRRKLLTEVKIEIEAYAVRAGADVEEASIDKLRLEAAEGRTARRVSWFERTSPDRRRIALGTQTRMVLLTGHDASGMPQTSAFYTGSRANLRTLLDHEHSAVRVDLEAGWSRLLSLDKKMEASGEVQVPTFASHTLRLTLGVPTGRFVMLGRIGETRIVEGLPELVVLGRFTPLERP